MEENYQYYYEPGVEPPEISTQGIIRILTYENQPPLRTWIPNEPLNKDWRRFQEWLSEGNTPLPPD